MFQLRAKDVDDVIDSMRRGSSLRVSNRAHVLHHRHKGCSIIETADLLEFTPRTVINICNTYKEHGLERALHDDPRPGRPPKFDARVRAQIVAMVCSDPPEGFDCWTLELLKEHAEKRGITDAIGKESIRVILQEHDLKPWQQQMWCVPDLNEEFIERMEDVLNVYERPYNPDNPVICLDEKPVMLHGDKVEPIAMSPGKPKRYDYEYSRNGSANTFCAVEPKAGFYMARVTERRTSADFAKFLASVERRYADAEKITLVMDNLNTHSKKSLTDFYGDEEGALLWNRFEVHYTPKHGSWLNQAEIALAMYQRQCLGNTRVPDIKNLRKRTNAWNRCLNSRAVSINWQFSTNDARETFKY